VGANGHLGYNQPDMVQAVICPSRRLIGDRARYVRTNIGVIAPGGDDTRRVGDKPRVRRPPGGEHTCGSGYYS
jgi:hypothetical protein